MIIDKDKVQFLAEQTSSIHEHKHDNLDTIFFVVGGHITTRTSAVTGKRSGLAKRFHGASQSRIILNLTGTSNTHIFLTQDSVDQ